MKNLLLSLASDKKKYEELRNLILTADETILSSINLKDERSGYSTLAVVVTSGDVKTAKLLIETGADVNTQDLAGRSPLHYVSENNDFEMAKLLLENGADLSIDNTQGNQPLWGAVYNNVYEDENNISLIKLYLQKGADPNHKNKSGLSPLGFVKEIGSKHLIDLLRGFS